MNTLLELVDKGSLSSLPLEVMIKATDTLDSLNITDYKARLTELALKTYENEDVTQQALHILESELSDILKSIGLILQEPSLTLLIDVVDALATVHNLDEDLLSGIKDSIQGVEDDAEILNIALLPLMKSTTTEFEFLVDDIDDSFVSLIEHMVERRDYFDIKTIVTTNRVLEWLARRFHMSAEEAVVIRDLADEYFDLPLEKILELYKGEYTVVTVVALTLLSKDGRETPVLSMRGTMDHLIEKHGREIEAGILIAGEYNE